MLLFIAPVSAFNQTLTEDRSVNRLVRPIVSSSWSSVMNGDLSGIHSFYGSRYAYTSYWKRRLLFCYLTNTTSWTRSSILESSFGTTWRRTKTDRTILRVSCIVSPNFHIGVERCGAVDWVLFGGQIWKENSLRFTSRMLKTSWPYTSMLHALPIPVQRQLCLLEVRARTYVLVKRLC